MSDQILDGAGINMDTTLDEFLANLRKRREKAQAETDELLKDPFFAKVAAYLVSGGVPVADFDVLLCSNSWSAAKETTRRSCPSRAATSSMI